MTDTGTVWLSPEAAAKKAGTSRFTIMRAIKSDKEGHLKASKDNRTNHWKIAQQHLEEWMKTRPELSANNDQKQGRTERDRIAITDQPELHTMPAQIEAAILKERLAVKEQALTIQREAHAREVAALQERLTSTEARLDQAQAEHRDQLAEITAKHDEQLTQARARHDEQLAQIEARHGEELTKSETRHGEELARTEARLGAQLEELRRDRAGWQQQAEQLTAQISQRKRRWWQRR